MLFETNIRTLANTMWLHTCRILNVLPEQHNISEKKLCLVQYCFMILPFQVFLKQYRKYKPIIKS